jgi:hypothetical protein
MKTCMHGRLSGESPTGYPQPAAKLRGGISQDDVITQSDRH